MIRSPYHPILLLSLLLAVFAGGCGPDIQAEEPPTEPPRVRRINVAVQALSRQEVRETLTLPATLEAWEDLTLAAELPGPVRWIGPQEGGRLQRGEAILRIDPETQEANLARAEVEYELRRKTRERMEQLLGQDLVSRQEFENARREYEAARAALRLAEVALEKSRVRSPVDGILDRLLVDRGEYVNEGDPVAVVVQVERLKVLADVPEKDVPFLAVGDGVEVIPALVAEAGSPLSGRIRHIAYRADPATRTYRTKIEVDNREGALRPGMIVRARFDRRTLPGVIAVPLYALVDRGGAKAVFVEEEGAARLRPVTVLAVVGGLAVVDGLEEGERLIVEGQQLVSDGTPVATAAGGG